MRKVVIMTADEKKLLKDTCITTPCSTRKMTKDERIKYGLDVLTKKKTR